MRHKIQYFKLRQAITVTHKFHFNKTWRVNNFRLPVLAQGMTGSFLKVDMFHLVNAYI